MNKDLMKCLVKHGVSWEEDYRGTTLTVVRDGLGWNKVANFLESNLAEREKRHVLAGKNVASFDYQFLPSMIQKFFRHRMIDIGAVALGANVDFWREKQPPAMKDLLGEEAAHDALTDARDNIRMLRKLTKNYGAGK